MSLMQTATDVIRQTGIPITWPAVGLAAVAAVGSWLSIVFNNRKWKASVNGGAKSTPVEKPGMGDTCREHGEAIASLVEFKDNTGKALANIDGKLDRLIEKLMG